MCVGIALALRLDGLDETAQVFGVLSDGDCQEGQTWEAATAAPHFGVTQPDRDRRLQPPADRRHDRGGHGHRRRARQVRVVRLGRGRDRRPRHGRGGRGAGAQPQPRPSGRDRLPDEEGQGRLGDGGPLRLPRQAARARSSPPRRSRSWAPGSRSRPGRCEPRSEGTAEVPAEAEDRADRDPRRLRRGARRPRRGARGGRRARRRPRRLDPVDQVRQGASRSGSSTAAPPRRT